VGTTAFDVVWAKPDPRNPTQRVWIKIGRAFKNDESKTGNLLIRLDAAPLSDEGHPVFPRELHVFLARGKEEKAK